jgi:hypothetical protein
MKRFETLALVTFWIIVLLIYLGTDLAFEMYTTLGSSKIFWGIGLAFFPIAIYTLLAVVRREESPWYSNVFTILILYGLHVSAAYFTIKKTDLLWSLAIHSSAVKTFAVIDVKKVIVSRGGFDHTDVTVAANGKQAVFEATKASYFLFRNKKQVTLSVGQSGWGNYYATKIYLPSAERKAARAEYWKDWWLRYKWLWVFIGAVILTVGIKICFFPLNSVTAVQNKPKLSFKQAMLLIIVIVSGLFILLVTGIYFYAHVLHHCNC